MTKQTRRSLLGLGMKSLGVAALAGMGRMAGQTGGASNRVLISIELSGGEDSNNLLVPLDPQGYGQYASGRGALAVTRPGLRPIEAIHQQATFGLPVEMTEVSALYTLKALGSGGQRRRPSTSHDEDAVSGESARGAGRYLRAFRQLQAHIPSGRHGEPGLVQRRDSADTGCIQTADLFLQHQRDIGGHVGRVVSRNPPRRSATA